MSTTHKFMPCNSSLQEKHLLTHSLRCIQPVIISLLFKSSARDAVCKLSNFAAKFSSFVSF